MKQSNRLIIVFAIGVLGFASNARAQQYGNVRSFSLGSQSSFNRSTLGAGARPAFSPYLNLLRRGNSTLSNYYGLVRPELDFRRADTQLRSGFGQLQREIGENRNKYNPSNLTISGHRAVFQSDLRGGPASVAQAISSRAGLLQNLPKNSGSRLAPTGHAVYFGNNSNFYRGVGR
jgi:hypothetical protein